MPEDCPAGTSYTISNGYRRVAGDSCDADLGVNRLPTVIPCPSVFGSVSSSGWTVLIVVFLLAAALFVATFLNKDPDAVDKIRSWFAERSGNRKYHKLDVKPDTFSDDEFDLTNDMEDVEAETLHESERSHSFGRITD